MTYLKDFRQRIAVNDYHNFLKLWEEYCYSDEIDVKELRTILIETKNSDFFNYFGQHVSKGLVLLDKIKDENSKHEILKLIFDIQNTNSSELAEFVYNYLKEKYSNDPVFDKKIHLVGLKTNENFQYAISRYELLSHIENGNFVFHTAGWGAGEILDYSQIREDVTIEFEYVVGKKTFSFVNAMKTLIPLSKDHFLSQRFGNPDALEEKGKKDPLSLIHLLLKDLGPKTAADIKDELCDLVIPESAWSKWWQTARSKMKKDTKIELPSNIHSPIRLLEHGISHEESLYQALEEKPSTDTIIQLVYSFMRDFSETLKNNEFKQSLEQKIQDVLSSKELTDTQKLELYFLLEDLNSSKHELTKQFISEVKNIEEVVHNMTVLSLKKRALVFIKQVRQDWENIFFLMFFNITPNVLRDYILSELNKIEDKARLNENINQLLKNPMTYPHVYVWYFQKIAGKKANLPFSDQQGQNKFFDGFLILLDYLYQKPTEHDLAKKMVVLLINNKFKIIQHFFKNSSIDEVREFLLLFTKCRILSNHDNQIIRALAESIYAELKKARPFKEEVVDTVVWTTADGYEKIKSKLDNIANDQILENAKEIEEARSHGDLKENAEYKAALEKRARLQGELKFLSEQFNHAKILSKDLVQTNKVNVGTVAHCENDKGEVYSFAILGPWDANPEKNILSFQSKLAESILGMPVGDEFNFQGEKYTITKITNYFDS